MVPLIRVWDPPGLIVTTPTLETVPPVVAKLCSCSASGRCRRTAPPPTRARRHSASTVTAFTSAMSMSKKPSARAS